MTQDDTNEGKPVLYWVSLGIIFAAFIAVVLA